MCRSKRVTSGHRKCDELRGMMEVWMKGACPHLLLGVGVCRVAVHVFHGVGGKRRRTNDLLRPFADNAAACWGGDPLLLHLLLHAGLPACIFRAKLIEIFRRRATVGLRNACPQQT